MPAFKCPTCGKEAPYVFMDEVPFHPFCSRRCKLVDLGKWLNEEYRVSEEFPESDRPPPDSSPPRQEPP
ncbi:MAG TPA: DNA gyrase inhibitor YacG [Phycisphaerae bacterium]|nr:DNA gyrase inhibitor YacG [Phycisphaerae bacterium]